MCPMFALFIYGINYIFLFFYQVMVKRPSTEAPPPWLQPPPTLKEPPPRLADGDSEEKVSILRCREVWFGFKGGL